MTRLQRWRFELAVKIHYLGFKVDPECSVMYRIEATGGDLGTLGKHALIQENVFHQGDARFGGIRLGGSGR